MMLDFKPAIVLLSETRTVPEMYDAEFHINNYNFIRCDSDSRHTGGVAMYIHENINFKIISNCEKERAWFLAIHIIKGYHTTGIFGVVYRSFQTTNPVFLNNFDEWLENVINHNKQNFIFGDCNIDVKSNEFYSVKLKQLIADNRLVQIVDDHTRVTCNSKSLIDVLITNSKGIRYEIVKEHQISDHYMISASINSKTTMTAEEMTAVEIRSWKNYSSESLNISLNQKLLGFQGYAEINQTAEDLILKLKTCVNELTHMTTIQKKNKIPWFSQNLKSLKQDKLRNYGLMKIINSKDNWDNYKKSRNLYKQSLRMEQSIYFKNKFIENKNKPKELWKTLKSMYKTKNQTQWNIQFNNKIISEKQELAEALNRSFVSSVIDIHNNIPEVKDWDFSVVDKCSQKFCFQIITHQDLFKIISSMNSNAGIDGINRTVMMDAMKNQIFSANFTELINQSLNQAKVPKSWKISTVIPIPKTIKPTTPEELRPINMLPPYEAIMERVIKNQLINHINKNNILVDQQSGFRELHSCETALNLMLDNWKSEINDNKVVVSVFLDFKRAFETIDRKILLKKLNKYGVQGRELEWFTNYLEGRQQYTKIDNYVSKPMPNNLGVPQGSILGPLLFILYINDIVEVIKNCQVNMFADDTLITTSAPTLIEAVQKVNEDLENLRKWLMFHKLSLNISKTKYMVMSIRTKIECEENIKVDNQIIERVKQYKYLGVVIDENLNFNDHLDYIAKKMNKKLGLFNRIKDKLPLETKIIFYESIVAPHIDYCSSVFFIMNQSQIYRLQKIQNRFMRAILRAESRTHIREMLEVLEWKSINQRINFNVLKLLFRLENGDLPNYLDSILCTNREVHNYKTRNTHFRLPLYSKSFSQRSLGYNGVKLYNSLSNFYTLGELRELKYDNFLNLLNIFIKDNISI